MLTQVFQKLALSAGPSLTTTHFSQAVDMGGSSSVLVTSVLFALSGGTSPTVAVAVQQSNDLENWADVGTSTSATSTLGYHSGTVVTSVVASYARVKVSLVNGASGTAVAIIASDLNTVMP